MRGTGGVSEGALAAGGCEGRDKMREELGCQGKAGGWVALGCVRGGGACLDPRGGDGHV